MNAVATARRVLAWAVDPAGPPPEGPVHDAAGLARVDAELTRLIGDLTRITAARLGVGTPPLGDAAPVGLGAALLAAAIGGRARPEQAKGLADAVPRFAGWSDAVARHGAVELWLRQQPAAGHVGERDSLDERLLRASPLSAVLHRPTLERLQGHSAQQEVGLAEELLSRPRGRRLLTCVLAAPSLESDVLEWRSELLQRLRLAHLDAVVDTYVTARIRHGADWDERLRWAREELYRGNVHPLAVATVRYWAALEAIQQSHPEQITARTHLSYGHDRDQVDDVVRLVQQLHLNVGGAQ
jgi:hypothetical protein